MCLRRLFAVVSIMLLVSCGGGSSDLSVTLTLAPTSVDVTGTQGDDGVIVNVNVHVAVSKNATLFVAVNDPGNLLTTARVVGGGGTDVPIELVARNDLSPGVYQGNIEVRVCNDAECAHPVAGGAINLPFKLTLLKAFGIAKLQILSRTGRDAAPVLDMPMDAPQEAGAVSVQQMDIRVGGLGDAFQSVDLVDGHLRVATGQAYPGDYVLHLSLVGTDTRYRRDVTVRYQVLPPEGGTQGFSYTSASALSANIQQGETASLRFKISRPTWTNDLHGPFLQGLPPTSTVVRDLGGDEYELVYTAHALGEIGSNPMLMFDAYPYGGALYVPVDIRVGQVFQVLGPARIFLSAQAPASDLDPSYAVTMLDDSHVLWTAESVSTGVQLVTGSGLTGVDRLSFHLDPLANLNASNGPGALVRIHVDHGAGADGDLSVQVLDNLPRILKLVSGPVVGDRGRLYLSAAYLNGHEGSLSVSGATLQSVWTPGAGGATQLDITGVSPGQPVIVTIASPMLISSSTVPTVAAIRRPSAFLALPYTDRPAPEFSSALNTLLFTEPGMLRAWVWNGSAWAMRDTMIPGALGASVRPDLLRVVVSTVDGLVTTDPSTGAVLSRLDWTLSGLTMRAMVSAPPALGRSLTYSAGSVPWFGQKQSTYPYTDEFNGVCSVGQPGMDLPLVDEYSGGCMVGYYGPAVSSRPFALVTSAGRRSMLAQPGDGYPKLLLDRGISDTQWTDLGVKLSYATRAVSLSDSGSRWVGADGVVQDRIEGQTVSATRLTSLNALVPSTHSVGGYALSGDGRYAAVYGYRLPQTPPAQPATDAAVWLVDLANGSDARILARLDLPSPVGCTGELSAGESCLHTAALLFDEQQLNLFILGPRGVAALELPAGVTRTVAGVRPRAATTLEKPVRDLRNAPQKLRINSLL